MFSCFPQVVYIILLFVTSLLLNDKMPQFLASGGDKFNPGPEMRSNNNSSQISLSIVSFR